MTQIIALFVDAYRLLNARRIFWFTLILTGLVVLCFALIGINEQGIRIIAWDLEIPGINTKSGYTPEFFYKVTFNNLGIGIWLTWVATVLGLVTTSGMFPEFISTGSIDLILSKPIGRMRLFVIKYLSGLLFVILQVCVFCVGVAERRLHDAVDKRSQVTSDGASERGDCGLQCFVDFWRPLIVDRGVQAVCNLR